MLLADEEKLQEGAGLDIGAGVSTPGPDVCSKLSRE
jgi:hypothetical protein